MKTSVTPCARNAPRSSSTCSRVPWSGRRRPPGSSSTRSTTPRTTIRTASGSRPASRAPSRTVSTHVPIRVRSCRLLPIQPCASRPARRRAGAAVPPSSTGGCGRCTGAGPRASAAPCRTRRRTRPGPVSTVPAGSAGTRPSARLAVRRARLRRRTPAAASRIPSPAVSRPPDSTSSDVSAFASSAGAVKGAQRVAVPSPIRSVCPATCASATIGSCTARCDGSSRPSAG